MLALDLATSIALTARSAAINALNQGGQIKKVEQTIASMMKLPKNIETFTYDMAIILNKKIACLGNREQRTPTSFILFAQTTI
jgi:hypothetical protein